MKAIVIYESNTGFTKKYAEWIAEELSCKAMPLKEALPLEEYDTLAFGGWFFAGSIRGYKEFKERLTAFQGKKVVFVTGAMPPKTPEAAQTLQNCFTDEERKSTGTFYLQGGLDYGHMKTVHKMMMKMLCIVMKKQKSAIGSSFDATDQAAIRPIIEYLR